jgi:hypothetical protein
MLPRGVTHNMGKGLGCNDLLEVLNTFREPVGIHVPSMNVVNIFKAALCLEWWGRDGALRLDCLEY